MLDRSVDIEKVDVLNNLANANKLDNSEKAQYYAQQAALLSDSLDYEKGEGYASQNLGFITYLYGDFETAIEHNQRAVEISDHLNDPELKRRAYEVLALIYEETNAYDNGLLYFQFSYEQNSVLNNPVGMGLALMGAGRIYEKLEQYELALRSNLRSMALFQQLGNIVGVAKSSLVIAKNYFYLDRPDSGSYFFNEAENIIRELNSRELLLDLYLEKVEVYSSSQIDSSLFYIDKAISLAGRLDRFYLKRDLLLQTSELHTKRGEYQMAYDFHQQYSHLNDSLLDLPVGMYPGRLELALNDAIYTEQQTEFGRINSFNFDGYRSGRWLVIGFGSIIVCISGLMFWLVFRYKDQRKSLLKMDVLQKEIASLSAEIVQKEKMIFNLRGNKKTRDKEIKDKESINNLDELKEARDVDEITRDEFLDNAWTVFVTKEWKKLKKVREELLIRQEHFSMHEYHREEWYHVNLDAITRSLINIKLKNLEGRINIHLDPDPAINLFCHGGSVLLLISCLLQNAIESIDGEGDIFIDFSSDNDKITYRIIDTGSGIAEDNLNNIFEPFYSTRKSNQHLGLGLSVCRDIVKTNKAVLRVKSKPGTATEVTLEFYYS